MQQYTSSALANTPADLTSVAPQFLPQKFTDDSILTIPIPLSALTPPSPTTTNPSSPSPNPTTNSTKSKSSFLGKLKGTDKSKGNGKGDFKMVKMTRREYLAYWAKDEEGRYIGTEPEGEGARRLRERGEV
ncbi:hypothetical protein Q9189_001744 [Teloschistes chrysophthalmus]